MNLQPVKKHENVTIILAPFDQYSALPDAAESILRETRPPFELVIIEGNAPGFVRVKLEKLKKHHKNIRIIYTAHCPTLAQAFNLGRPHVRTAHAFFTHNNVRMTPQWLEGLLRHAKEKPGVVCPYVAHHDNPAREKELPEVCLHGFLISKEALDKAGPLDEETAAPLLGLELGLRLKKHGIVIHRDPLTVLLYEPAGVSKSFDIKFFQHQWNENALHTSILHLRKKWALRLQESKYHDWLQQKKRRSSKNRATVAGALAGHGFSLRLDVPKISFRKFLQVLNRA